MVGIDVTVVVVHDPTDERLGHPGSHAVQDGLLIVLLQNKGLRLLKLGGKEEPRWLLAHLGLDVLHHQFRFAHTTCIKRFVESGTPVE